MSPEVFAALLGVLGGVIIERIARSWGRLWCETSGWAVRFLPEGSYIERYGIVQRLPQVEEQDAHQVMYSVRVDLFNGKEIPVGLRNVSLIFKCSGGEVRSVPKDNATEYMPQTGGRRSPTHARTLL
jgi:hypothetical protein